MLDRFFLLRVQALEELAGVRQLRTVPAAVCGMAADAAGAVRAGSAVVRARFAAGAVPLGAIAAKAESAPVASRTESRA